MRNVCSHRIDGDENEFSILFPRFTKESSYRGRGRSELMMMPIVTGLAAISADSRFVAFGVTRRRSTLSDAFEELIFIVSLKRNGEVDGPPRHTTVGDYDCVAGFSPDNRQLAVSSQRSVRHHGQNAIHIRLLNVFGSVTDQQLPKWATIYCNEKRDKGPRRFWTESFDVTIRYPRLAFAVLGELLRGSTTGKVKTNLDLAQSTLSEPYTIIRHFSP